MRLVVALLVLPALSGCLGDFWNDLNRPDIAVSRTDLDDRNEAGYVTVPLFSVQVMDAKGAEVEITAKSSDGRRLRASDFSDPSKQVAIELEDGVWTVSYAVAGHNWETFRNVKVDATPPSTAGLRTFAQDDDGSFTVGRDYAPEQGVTIEVRDAEGGLLGRQLPLTVTGLADGIHFFVVVLQDPAGNQATHTIQVAAGEATHLPAGQHTFGIVARYTNEARLWDLSDLGAYLSPDAARQETGDQWLGSEPANGQDTDFGITPDHPEVQAVVDEVLDGGETTAEAAWKLFRWLLDELEYTEERLESDDLLTPAQTFANEGGVCRDLAATYVSLLRGAGVPARLVSGYLAGNVDGFHAWVEVYVGARAGQSPWLPIDVSPIDGRWDDPTGADWEPGDPVKGMSIAVQSFGIQLPQYLTLRQIPDAAEVDGWSTALGTEYEYSSPQPPQLEFVKTLEDVGQRREGLLCFDPDTLVRQLRTSISECSGMYIIGRDAQHADFKDNTPFIVGTQRVIDYGVRVDSVDPGTTITMRLSYPFPADVQPDTVQYAPYVSESLPQGSRVTQEQPDAFRGTVTAVLRR